MKHLRLSPTEEAVLNLIREKGRAAQADIMSILPPELGHLMFAEVMRTLYRFRLIREVDYGVFEPRASTAPRKHPPKRATPDPEVPLHAVAAMTYPYRSFPA